MNSKRRRKGKPSVAKGDSRGCQIVVGREESCELGVGVEAGGQ